MPALTRRSALSLTAAAAFAGAADAAGAAPLVGEAFALGRANAPVTVTEYASVTCGHCADWDLRVWPAFKAEYVDGGQVRYELREMLTPPTQLAAAGWLLARCAGPDKYLSVVKALYRGQAEMAAGDARGVLLRIAREAGVTEARFAACLRDREAIAALNARVEAAVARGVESTPTFFINGRKHEGAIDMAGLDAALRPLLARRR